MSNDDTYKAFASRPHLVIVGTGATIDSIPKGDKNSRPSAEMKGFIDKLGFTYTFRSKPTQSEMA